MWRSAPPLVTILDPQGNTLAWKPSTHVPQGCGDVAATLIFSATDSDGTSTDQVGVKVHYPVC